MVNVQQKEGVQKIVDKLRQSSSCINNYNVQKIIEAFKKLKCNVYINKQRVRVEFQGSVNPFYIKELRLAFKKCYREIWEILRFQNLDKLRTNDLNEWIKVL